MQFATWNVNSLTIRLPQVLDWLAANPVDALVLQETKMTDDKFPLAELAAAGYRAEFFGQKTYNGVALLTKGSAPAALDVVKNIPHFEDEQARVIAGTVEVAATDAQEKSALVRVVGAYFPNGQAPGSDKFAYKMRWLSALRTWLQAELAQHPHLVLMGDFNIAPDDRDVPDVEAWRGQIHCTEEERGHFQALLGLGLVDAFRHFEPGAKHYTWWDYRELAFRRNKGLRIDHILSSSALVPRLQSCTIDKAPRKNERPSDHTPLVLTLGS